jgi:TRAP-type C4-dicarboxylate transport system permease large subunit
VGAIFRGSALFCVPLAIGLVLVLLFPAIALWLPGLMR